MTGGGGGLVAAAPFSSRLVCKIKQNNKVATSALVATN